MTQKRVNIDWVRKTIGVLLLIQVIPFIWAFSTADHWGTEKSPPFDWSLFWPAYWAVYRSFYGWVLGISAFIIIVFFCFASLKDES